MNSHPHIFIYDFCCTLFPRDFRLLLCVKLSEIKTSYCDRRESHSKPCFLMFRCQQFSLPDCFQKTLNASTLAKCS
ncbi:hypothetical protein F7725_015116, partial [Dissostichus mawsoni]